MTKDNKIDIPVPKFDELFKSTVPEEVIKEKVVNLQLKDIVPFPNHPFKVNDIELDEMVESIKNIGVNVPITVRKSENGEYQIISGHRRKRACDILGIKEIPCIIRNLTDDEAVIQMVDSNIQRVKILPSEKAFSYKMKLDALKHQGKRNDLEKKTTSSQVATKLEEEKSTADKVGEKYGDGKDNVYRFIRLTKLIPDILELVDNEKIAVNPASEIAYLTEDEQYVLLDIMQCTAATPSLAQAIRFKKLSQEGNLTVEKMEEIMLQPKANQKDKYNITYDKFMKYIPRQVVTPQEVENYLLKCAIACQQMGIQVEQIKIDEGNTKQKVLQRER